MTGPIYDIREFTDNEGNPTPFSKKLDEFDYEYSKEQLKIADCALSLDACLEIKNVLKSGFNDVWESLKDGRVHKQSKSRNENYKWNGLIVMIEEGASLYNEFFTRQHWITLRFTLITNFNTHIFIVKGEEEKVILIYALWKTFKEGPYYVDPCNKTPRPDPDELYNNQMYLLSGLFDMGKDKCKKLLDYFRFPILIIKWIIQTKIIFTAGGNPKISETSDTIKGFGPKFFLKNQKILQERE